MASARNGAAGGRRAARGGAALAALALGLAARAAADERVEIGLAARPEGGSAASSLTLAAAMPGRATAWLRGPDEQWRTFRALEFHIAWPEDAPPDAQVLVHLMDWDHRWFQWLAPGRLTPGTTTRFVADLSPGAAGWEPDGHFGAFQFRTLMAPREFGIRVFGDREWNGEFRVERVAGLVRAPGGPPPVPRRVRASTTRPPVYGKFELQFELPDRYAAPFDPDEIAVRAVFERPDGVEEAVDGFFTQDYVRRTTPAGERFVPQGPPSWKVRYTPRVAGLHRYRLATRDAHGEGAWGPGRFEARASDRPGFVRVSARDPRYFEFDRGEYFHPLGHNMRSPFDTRYDRQFPWRQRFPEGPSVYERYFRLLRAHRANFAEIWTAAWSLGLEWRSGWEGYHGVGQYNLMHAWQLDRVVEEAERQGVYLNVVIHNHGKFSDWSDAEWENNPFNAALGGYLKAPDDFFTDPRARSDFLQLMRYMNSRWGYSPNVFSWELWSELDLTGSRDRQPRSHHRPEVIEWHADMGRAIRAMDPYGRLVATHVCGDYTHQNPDIVKLPEISFVGIDAYHSNPNPLHIVELLRRSAEFNNPFGKPVLVTEFGGSPMAQQGLRHVTDAFFAAVWASTALPLGGTPLFWWWQMMEEEGLFTVYEAVGRFLEGEDRRDPALVTAAVEVLRGGAPAADPAVVAMASPGRALGWLYRTEGFDDIDPDGPPTCTDAELRVPGLADGAYVVEFWNTQFGRRFAEERAESAGGALRVRVPPFARDLAFKVRPAP